MANQVPWDIGQSYIADAMALAGKVLQQPSVSELQVRMLSDARRNIITVHNVRRTQHRPTIHAQPLRTGVCRCDLGSGRSPSWKAPQPNLCWLHRPRTNVGSALYRGAYLNSYISPARLVCLPRKRARIALGLHCIFGSPPPFSLEFFFFQFIQPVRRCQPKMLPNSGLVHFTSTLPVFQDE